MRYKTAIAAQLALLIYFELCVFVPLGRWNDQTGHSAGFSAGNLAMGAAIGLAQLLLLAGTIWQLKWLLWLGLVGDGVWLLLHIQSLWMPYIVGASPQYVAMYDRVFSRTTKVLPSFGAHLAPDAMHIVIDLLLAAVLTTLIIYMRSLKSQKTVAPAEATTARFLG